MTRAANTVMTLYHWNILILPSGEEIFVGLRQRPETVPPFKPADEEDELLPFTLRNSSPITEFKQTQGIGYTESGRRYVVIGQPSDPTGLIRLSVTQMMPTEQINWKYPFSD
ncbi:hypothetical protein [Methylophaga sulfidovorans]|uniref:Uncharacterized protein n=1 Tax=Methylophaga sulfidovorans TaxID=45496 RepID=A0A1I4A6F9_9GAMM|nr:hypothetical protein [Methylophaga sulfidovorans]SFK51923.1 hypothetical protein SAMN04488079_11353 [Methylophaga sulfidovorans]